MTNTKFTKKLLMVIFLSCVLSAQATNVFAYSKDRGRGKEISRDRHDNYGHRNYGYRDHYGYWQNYYRFHHGRFYKSNWFGIEIAIGIPPIGAVFTVLPSGYRTVRRGSVVYYSYNNVYFTHHPYGYVVVEEPRVQEVTTIIVPSGVTQSRETYGDKLVVNVPNENGSFTPVTLTKTENGYIGPQGEFYFENPTIEQLKVLYGKS